MQIKSFYLDLKEGPQYAKKNNNVWLLESEAFTEPLNFTFTFDNDDIRILEKYKEDCGEYRKLLEKKESEIDDRILELNQKLEMITKSYQKLEGVCEKYDKLIEQIKEKENLIRDKELRENEKIGDLQREINLVNKKLDLPEPQKIYTKTWEEFVTGSDTYYCSPYHLNPGDYVIIEQYEYEPQNEWVLNQNEIQIREEYLTDDYYPKIKLYCENGIDNPVSKVRLTVLFFQI